VWDVIADGWTYSQWVVGNSRTRAVDPSWPSPGSTIHHSIGVWPALLNDETVAVACEPLQELVLVAKGRPFGAARITLRLNAVAEGCRIEMSEVPVSRPWKWLPAGPHWPRRGLEIENAPGGWPRLPNAASPVKTTTSGGGAVDAVVIGAGHNGLVAAALLADAGWDVLVLEAQAEPGGAVKSAELTPGYLSDL
jgi:NADPH-dependent 2,4-dienoyl-CoA reductase/sulfur reductase-like enzyme